MARQGKIKMILIQREYDPRNVRALADETGGRVELIDPFRATGIHPLRKSSAA